MKQLPHDGLGADEKSVTPSAAEHQEMVTNRRSN